MLVVSSLLFYNQESPAQGVGTLTQCVSSSKCSIGQANLDETLVDASFPQLILDLAKMTKLTRTAIPTQVCLAPQQQPFLCTSALQRAESNWDATMDGMGKNKN